MNKKFIKDISVEEIAQALNLISREGENKFRLQNQAEKVQTISVETENYNAIIKADIDSDVQVEVVEETDKEFGRRVRFNIKVENFRKQQALREEQEARKPKLIKRFNAFKRNLNKTGCEALDLLEERLTKVK